MQLLLPCFVVCLSQAHCIRKRKSCGSVFITICAGCRTGMGIKMTEIKEQNRFLPPMRMHPAYRHGDMTPWGGEQLKTVFGKDIPDERTGEALEMSVIPGLESTDDESCLSPYLQRLSTKNSCHLGTYAAAHSIRAATGNAICSAGCLLWQSIGRKFLYGTIRCVER